MLHSRHTPWVPPLVPKGLGRERCEAQGLIGWAVGNRLGVAAHQTVPATAHQRLTANKKQQLAGLHGEGPPEKQIPQLTEPITQCCRHRCHSTHQHGVSVLLELAAVRPLDAQRECDAGGGD